MHGNKNIPSANPLFSGIIMSSPYSPHKYDKGLTTVIQRSPISSGTTRFRWCAVEDNSIYAAWGGVVLEHSKAEKYKHTLVNEGGYAASTTHAPCNKSVKFKCTYFKQRLGP